MALPERLTVNLRTEDVEISREEVEELVERSDASSTSELIRELLDRERQRLDDGDTS